ncbi:flagellar assembly protein FliH [Rhodoferax sp. PAMC 29310]|uniref:FliH/SctL family protein n=1 Tax=Rhodoferax sp. PAMC 29310 TaxID=2822760 RepID=UPI001B343EDA|nr:flagellar assembly protein FliH [Rhodoferax sp. PAMC 29310]
MRNYSRFIPGEEIDSFKQWDFGAVDSAALLLAAKAKEEENSVESGKDDALTQQGYAQGYAEGFVQGQAQLRLEAQRQISEFVDQQGQEASERFLALFANAQAQLMESEQVIAQGVLELACELARQVIRQEISVNPNVLQPVIREAMGLLGVETKAAVVRLSPADFEVLEDPVRTEFAAMSLTLVADSNLSAGGCLIESAGTVIDGRIEKRWSQVVASLGLNQAWGDGDEPA